MTIDLREIQSYMGTSNGKDCTGRGGHFLTYKAIQPGFGPTIPDAYMFDCIGCPTTIIVEKDQPLVYIGIVPDLSRPEITDIVYRL